MLEINLEDSKEVLYGFNLYTFFFKEHITGNRITIPPWVGVEAWMEEKENTPGIRLEEVWTILLLHLVLEEQFKDHHREQDQTLIIVLLVDILDKQVVEWEAGHTPAGLGEEVSDETNNGSLFKALSTLGSSCVIYCKSLVAWKWSVRRSTLHLYLLQIIFWFVLESQMDCTYYMLCEKAGKSKRKEKKTWCKELLFCLPVRGKLRYPWILHYLHLSLEMCSQSVDLPHYSIFICHDSTTDFIWHLYAYSVQSCISQILVFVIYGFDFC